VIGLLGGTFDPIHVGHLRLAEEVRETLGLAQLRFVPAARPPHRDEPVTTGDRRLELVRLAVADNPAFSVDAREYEREGRSYTVDTLQSIREEVGADQPLVWIMGMDAFNGFTRWHRWRGILDLAHLAVATRPGSRPEAEARALLAAYGMDAAAIAAHPAGGIHRLPITRLDISATAVRKRLQAGQSLRYLVPESVRKALIEG